VVSKILIIQPYFDDATIIWGNVLRACLEKGKVKPEPGYVFLILWGDDAVPDKVYKALEDPDVVGIGGYGAAHGDVCVFTGQRLVKIFECGSEKNALLKGRYWNPVSCLVGYRLCKEFVERWGVPVAVGNTEVYWIVTYWGRRGWENDPAASFLIANATFDQMLQRGATASEAYKAMLDAYEREAQAWENIDPEVSYYLRYDARYRAFYGDPNWRLPPPPPVEYVCPWCFYTTTDQEDMKKHILETHCPRVPPGAGTYSGTAEGVVSDGAAEGYVQWGVRQYKIVLNKFSIPVKLECRGEWRTSQATAQGQIEWSGTSRGRAVGRAEGYMQFGLLRFKVVLTNVELEVETEDKGTATKG